MRMRYIHGARQTARHARREKGEEESSRLAILLAAGHLLRACSATEPEDGQGDSVLEGAYEVSTCIAIFKAPA